SHKLQFKQKNSKLDFFYLTFEEKFARVKGYFEPINNIDIHLDGKSYASANEDDLVRIDYFDNDYLDYDVVY
ncbi:unnamed protein product, partial [Rotaria sp. Silwood1]